jgi:hypothetical protein
VSVEIDEATARFLETARVDLQRQVGIAGTVEEVAIEARNARGISLMARVRVASRTVVFKAWGDNLVDAYAGLAARGPEPILASAFAQLLETLPSADAAREAP